jgi:hypothetical protein
MDQGGAKALAKLITIEQETSSTALGLLDDQESQTRRIMSGEKHHLEKVGKRLGLVPIRR